MLDRVDAARTAVHCPRRLEISKASGWVVALLSDYATVLELPADASALAVVPAVAAAPEHAAGFVAAPAADVAAGAAAAPAAASFAAQPVAAAPEHAVAPTVEPAAGAVAVPAAVSLHRPPAALQAARGRAPAVAEPAVVPPLAARSAFAALANADARERYLRCSATPGGGPAVAPAGGPPLTQAGCPRLPRSAAERAHDPHRPTAKPRVGPADVPRPAWQAEPGSQSP